MASKYPTRVLGKSNVHVSAIGLGLMGMSFAYGPRKSEEESFKVLSRAADLGITFFDTADVYGYGHNEVVDASSLIPEMLGRWFKKTGRRNEIFLCTKFGNKFDGGKHGGICGTPEYVRQACEASLKRLGVDQIDLYYLHRYHCQGLRLQCRAVVSAEIDGRADKTVPIEETVAAMGELVKEGKVKYIGLSEVSSETLRRASKVHQITAVQIEYSPWALDIENPSIALLKTCRELGVTTISYSPLGRGFLTGQIKSRDDLSQDDFRRISPRFSEENFSKNLELVDKLTEIAKRKGCTASQLTLAWLLAQGDDIIPIPGTTSVQRLQENAQTAKIQLTKEEVEEVRRVAESAEIRGARYPEMMQGALFADTPKQK